MTFHFITFFAFSFFIPFFISFVNHPQTPFQKPIPNNTKPKIRAQRKERKKKKKKKKREKKEKRKRQMIANRNLKKKKFISKSAKSFARKSRKYEKIKKERKNIEMNRKRKTISKMN